jgi:ATP-dependent Clp protease ATP-binding subunit ClpA
MYERFTDRLRKVMQLANQAARLHYHEYVGTEHLLLGLVMEGKGVACHVLKTLGHGKEKTAMATGPKPSAEERAEMASAPDALSLALSAAAVKIRAGEDCSDESPLAKKIKAALGSLPYEWKM